jgi:hypothetical protein
MDTKTTCWCSGRQFSPCGSLISGRRNAPDHWLAALPVCFAYSPISIGCHINDTWQDCWWGSYTHELWTLLRHLPLDVSSVKVQYFYYGCQHLMTDNVIRRLLDVGILKLMRNWQISSTRVIIGKCSTVSSVLQYAYIDIAQRSLGHPRLH